MVDVITERKQEELDLHQKVRLVEAELSTKYTVMGMAVAAQSKKGTKWLQTFVQKMNFLKALSPQESDEPEQIDEKDLPSTAQVMAAFGAGPDGQVGKRSD